MTHNYEPRKVYYRLRNAYPAFRWLIGKNQRKGESWNEYPDQMTRIWGMKKQWSAVIDGEGGTIYGPDGDGVFWEDPKK